MSNKNLMNCMNFKINEDGSHNASEIADFVKAESWEVNGDKLTLFNLVLFGKKEFSVMNDNDVIITGINAEQQNEQEIQSKNLNASRLTPDYIDSKIKAVEYILPRDVCKRDNGVEVFDAPLPLQILTFCILTDAVKSTYPINDNQARASGSVGECIHRSKLLNNRENAYLLTQLLNTLNINSDLRKKAETKMTALLDELI